jgi:hypothetical protein
MAARWRTLMASTLIAAAPIIHGCGESDTAANGGLVRVDVTDDAGARHTFFLEPALDNDTRVLGLSHREQIAPDGGMIFVFSSPRVQEFVMRHCPIPIDIVYLDAAGRVTAAHAMTPEDPQREGESDADYNQRLKRYSSRYSVPVVLEFAAGTNQRLGIAEGDAVKIHGLETLRTQAK